MGKSTRSTGQKYEKMYRGILEGQGYQCSPSPKKVMWIPKGPKRIPVVSDSDYYGVFDIISFNQHHWRLSQVTGWDSGMQYPRMNKIISFIKKNPLPPGSLVEVCAFRGGRKRLDKRFTKEKVYVPNQLFYIYSLVFNEFKETQRIHKRGEILWTLKGFYESYKNL